VTQVSNIISNSSINDTVRVMQLRIAAYQLYLNESVHFNQSLAIKTTIINCLSSLTSSYSSDNDDLTNDATVMVPLIMQTLAFLTDTNSPVNDYLITQSLTVI